MQPRTHNRFVFCSLWWFSTALVVFSYPVAITALQLLAECLAAQRLQLRSLVSHSVDDVVDSDAKAESRELFRVLRAIGMLPRITQIHVVTNRHYKPAMVVIDAAPSWLYTVLLIHAVSVYKLLARNLIAILKVITGVKNGIAIDQFHNRSIGKYLLHARRKCFPFNRAMEIITPEKSAAI